MKKGKPEKVRQSDLDDEIERHAGIFEAMFREKGLQYTVKERHARGYRYHFKNANAPVWEFNVQDKE